MIEWEHPKRSKCIWTKEDPLFTNFNNFSLNVNVDIILETLLWIYSNCGVNSWTLNNVDYSLKFLLVLLVLLTLLYNQNVLMALFSKILNPSYPWHFCMTFHFCMYPYCWVAPLGYHQGALRERYLSRTVFCSRLSFSIFLFFVSTTCNTSIIYI